MADVAISAAPDAGALLGTDKFPLARSGSTGAYSTTVTSIINAVKAGGGGGGGGGGTVTSITAGAGLSGGTITNTGTISMPSVGAAGSWNSANIIVDAQGRVVSASDGTAGAPGGGVIVATPVHSTAMETGHVLKATAGTCYFVDALNGTSTQALLVILDSATVPADGTVSGVIDAIPLPPNGHATFNPAGAAAACANGIVAFVSTNVSTPYIKVTTGVSAYFTGIVQ